MLLTMSFPFFRSFFVPVILWSFTLLVVISILVLSLSLSLSLEQSSLDARPRAALGLELERDGHLGSDTDFLLAIRNQDLVGIVGAFRRASLKDIGARSLAASTFNSGRGTVGVVGDRVADADVALDDLSVLVGLFEASNAAGCVGIIGIGVTEPATRPSGTGHNHGIVRARKVAECAVRGTRASATASATKLSVAIDASNDIVKEGIKEVDIVLCCGLCRHVRTSNKKDKERGNSKGLHGCLKVLSRKR